MRNQAFSECGLYLACFFPSLLFLFKEDGPLKSTETIRHEIHDANQASKSTTDLREGFPLVRHAETITLNYHQSGEGGRGYFGLLNFCTGWLLGCERLVAM